jgi:hypothetical protein
VSVPIESGFALAHNIINSGNMGGRSQPYPFLPCSNPNSRAVGLTLSRDEIAGAALDMLRPKVEGFALFG